MGAPGFDDAPTVAIEMGDPKSVTMVYPYYENPNFLKQQLQFWAEYPEDLRKHVSVIVVDDGSPTNPAVDVLRGIEHPINIRLFRIEVDVRWNWLAARNIGMHHASACWCVLTDMDHVVTPGVLNNLVHGKHNSSFIYRFSRCEHTGAKIHPHPNSMFMTRDMFWKVGGYDEALSGHYGTDGDWRRRCAMTAKVKTLQDELVRYEYFVDSSTTHYKRKQPEDAGKKAILAKRGRNWKAKTLSFPYHEESLCST